MQCKKNVKENRFSSLKYKIKQNLRYGRSRKFITRAARIVYEVCIYCSTDDKYYQSYL